MTTQASAAEARRLVVAVALAAIDQRDDDLHELLADADRDDLAIAVGGMAIVVSTALGEVSPERRAAIREYLADCALGMAAWPEVERLTADQHRRRGLRAGGRRPRQATRGEPGPRARARPPRGGS